jgi:DNA-binding NarL/FixJ family response regulator
MRAGIERFESSIKESPVEATRRLRLVVADASLDFMSVVLCLLEFHDDVDLIGRASTFEETIQLVVNQEPDLVLIDLDMPLANLAIPAIILSARRSVGIVGMCSGETVSMEPIEILMSMDALVHKAHLTDEFRVVLHTRLSGATSGPWISSSPKPEQPTDQRNSGRFGQIIH